MQSEDPHHGAPETRSKAILSAAFEVFRLYGFRRTTMEDIAQAAGVSRAALYLHFRNKEDIFRSLAQYYFDTTATAVAQILGGTLPPVAALSAAFAAQGAEIMRAILTSPHAAEFTDLKSLTSADIVAAGEARLAAIYADWLTREQQAGRIRMDPAVPAADLAQTMVAALNGLKAGQTDFEAYRASVARLAALFGRALTP